MRKVFILGNGFDLNLGLKTSYSHFLASKNFEDFLSKTSNDNRHGLAKHLVSIHDSSRWVDVEKELANFSLKLSDAHFMRDYRILRDSLQAYLLEVQNSLIKAGSVAEKLFADNYQDGDEFSVISFNYTNTAEKILIGMFERMYGRNPRPYSIEYIHGSVNAKNIIFGVDDSHEISPGHAEIRKTTHLNFSGKKIRNALLDHSDEIHFFGLSLGETDHMYFREYFLERLCKLSQPKKHFFYYYEDIGYNNLHQQFHQLTDGQVYKLKMLNKLEFINLI